MDVLQGVLKWQKIIFMYIKSDIVILRNILKGPCTHTQRYLHEI